MIEGLEALFARLSREPDFDAPELQAYDVADLLLLDQAFADEPVVPRAQGSLLPSVPLASQAESPSVPRAELLPAPRTRRSETLATPGILAIIGDRHGALTVGAASLGATGIRVHQDPLLGERALNANAERLGCRDAFSHHPLGEQLLAGAKLVLLQLPKSLAELEEIAQNIARFAAPDVVVLAGGRDKHMSRGMNEVLAREFEAVTASRGWRKARVLTVTSPRGVAVGGEAGIGGGAGSGTGVAASAESAASAVRAAHERWPVWGSDPDLSFELAAFGATFGGATLDHGSRLLLRTLHDHPPSSVAGDGAPSRVADIGCGNGVLAVSAARAWPEARVIASDQSAAAVAATRLTAERAGVLAPGLGAPGAPGPGAVAQGAVAQGRPGTLAEAVAAATVEPMHLESPGVHLARADAAEAVPDAWAELVLLNPPFHTGSTVHAGVAQRIIQSLARALAPGGELRLVFNSHLGYRQLVERAVGPTEQLARDRTFTVLRAVRR